MSDLSPAPPRRTLGLPVLLIVGLGALAAVRGVLHDLGIIQEGEPVNLAFVVVPILVWLAVAVWRSTRPFISLLAAGLVYGVLLAVTHLVLWDLNLQIAGVEAPALGGNLEGVLPGWVEATLLRGAASLSSLLVGLAVGAATGLVAWLLQSGVRALRTRTA